MHASVIIPFCYQDDARDLQWTLEGFDRQHLSSDHTFDVLVGIDGGQGQEISLPSIPPACCKFTTFPRIGLAAVCNALVKAADSRSELLIFIHAARKPDTRFVQCHVDSMAKLPTSSLVLGAVMWQPMKVPTVFDLLVDQTPLVYNFSRMKTDSWFDFRFVNSTNFSIRRDHFSTSPGFPNEFRLQYYYDTVFAHRLLGSKESIFYDPSARVLNRNSMTLDQSLDREETLGMMASILARLAPETFSTLLSTRASGFDLAQRYAAWVSMDTPIYKDSYISLNQWAAQAQSTVEDSQFKAMLCSTLYQLHLPLRRLAFRLGFVRGMSILHDFQGQLHEFPRLWREKVRPSIQ